MKDTEGEDTIQYLLAQSEEVSLTGFSESSFRIGQSIGPDDFRGSPEPGVLCLHPWGASGLLSPVGSEHELDPGSNLRTCHLVTSTKLFNLSFFFHSW